jgi:hypothetical protein
MQETQIDVGNFDWIIAEDSDGNVWVRPSLDWKDGEVYESFANGKSVYKTWVREIND